MEDQDPPSLETMSDGDVLLPSAPFTRGCKARASLPVGRSNGQSRERQLGVLYLQYGEETKQIRMPTDISSQDALRALFVTAFPHQLTMKMLQSPNMAIYIKDTSRNVYYDLEDIRNITPHSCLKAYHKDPAHVFNRHARPASTEGRISKEVLYGSHSPVHTLSSSNRNTLHSLQGSMSPPMVRSMPSSPSKMAYSGGGARGGSMALDPNSATLPRERLSAAGRASTLCTSSSAILERRDVKPDEDIGSSKSMALVLRGEGGPLYPDSYCSSLQDGRAGRLSTSSSQCSAPPSLTADMVDSGVPGIPGGLQQYRASVKPLMGYGESMEHQTRSLHRQKSRKYGDSQLPPMGTKTPPPSPHRVSEVRMSDGQIIGGLGLVSPERMSPIRRSLRRDSNGAPVEVINRSRGSGSSSSTSSVFVDSPLGQPERLFQGYVTTNSDQSERMKAMEEQIASLAGLVHHALSMGSDVPGFKEVISESAACKPFSSRPGMSSEPPNPDTLTDSFSTGPLALQAPPSDSELQHRLVSAKRNVCELRLQLSQLRRLQLSNQESVNSMLRMAGQELVVLMCERLTQSEEAAYRRRAQMEEERIHYLAAEERILTQLSELEDYVDRLQRSSTSSSSHLSISLRDVEDGAVSLRRVGEALAVLKGEFPELQGKMRSVLRLEVEAVRFLKEEPLKMDSMLKRVKALTETLGSLRRCVSESTPPAKSAQVEPIKVLETDQQSPQSSPRPQPRSSVRPPLPTPPLSGSEADVSLADSASPIMARRMKSTAASASQPSHHYPSPPLTPSHGRNSPTVAKVSPHSRQGSPALQRKPGLQHLDGPDKPAATIEQQGCDQTMTAERQTPEGSLSVETNSVNLSGSIQANQPSSSDSSQTQPSNTSTDINTVQASPEDRICDVSDHTESRPNSALGQTCPTAPKQDTPLPLTAASEMSPKLSDEVDSTQLKPDTAPASQPPAATVEPPPSVPLSAPPSPAPSTASSAPPSPAPLSASSSTERCGRPQMEKPRRSSVDKEMKQSPDRAGKSPPPPPPRRFHAVSSGVTTGRSGEVVLTIRKEPVGAQDDDEKEKEPMVPQPKPPRQPPEVKPKPQMCAPAPLPGCPPTPATTPAYREDKEEDEEEDNKFITELQVTELSNESRWSNGNKQNVKVQTRTSSNSQMANQTPSELSFDQRSAPQLRNNGCVLKVRTVTGMEEHNKGGRNKEVEKRVKLAPSFDCTPAERVEVAPLLTSQPSTQNKVEAVEAITLPVSQRDASLTVNNNQINRDTAAQIISSTAEKKVKFTTVVTLQNEGTDTSPKDTPAVKKSNMTAVLTLQKENPTKDCLLEQSPLSPQSQKCLSSGQECATPTSLTTPFPSLTYRKDNQAAMQVYRDHSLDKDEGGSLSPTMWDDEGPPPPPPPIGKFRVKARIRTQSKEQDQAKTKGSGIQALSVDSTSKPTDVGHENYGFEDSDDTEMKPIIFILNDPLDIQSAYKRLSTIFECEEDLDATLSPEMVEEEEETKQKEEEQGVRQICITEKDITGIGQNGHSLQMQHDRHSPNNDSALENQQQSKTDSPRKADTKKKFKFKLPKNKLAAISQVIRTGANKTKKTLEVVVYEEAETITSDSSPIKETKKQTKDSKRIEISSSKQLDLEKGKERDKSHNRVEELCKSTFDSISSLEESIKQLEISVDSMAAPSPTAASPPHSLSDSLDRTPPGKIKQDRRRERSPSKRPAPQILKGPNLPQSKRAKPQPPLESRQTTTKKQTSSSSSSSSAQRPHTKPRHSSSSSSPEKAKGQLPATQKQPSQADSRSSRAAGDSSHCVVALRASKIPALCHSPGKHPSTSLSTPHCSDTADSPQNLSSSSSSSASSPSASSSCGKHFPLSPPSNVSKCPSRSSSPSSSQRTRLQGCSSSSLMKISSSYSPPHSPSPPLPSHKSFIPSLNLSRLLPSSSHALSPSHANVSSSKRQHRLVLASTSSSTSTTSSQQSYYSSSSYSSSSPSSSSSSTSSSLSPTSSSSSPPSPSSSLLPTMVSHGARSTRMSASNPGSPAHGRKRGGSQAVHTLRTMTATAASKDAS